MIVDLCRQEDLQQSEVEGWIETFVKAGEKGLRVNAKEEKAAHEKELRELRAKAEKSKKQGPQEGGIGLGMEF